MAQNGAAGALQGLAQPPARGGMALWRGAMLLLAGISLAIGVLLASWGATLCLDSYESLRVLPDGSTTVHTICLRRLVAWSLVGFGASVALGAGVALAAAVVASERPRLAGGLALLAGLLTLPVGGVSRALLFLAVPGGMALLGLSALFYRPAEVGPEDKEPSAGGEDARPEDEAAGADDSDRTDPSAPLAFPQGQDEEPPETAREP